MPATSGKATPIYPFQDMNSARAQVPTRRIAEKASQTALIGTPVQLSSGFIQACATINSAASALIAGFAQEFFSNLSSSGVAKTLTYGAVQNQSAAVLIPVGAPPNDGTIGLNVAEDDVSFIGTFGDGADNTLAVLTQADIGVLYGLTKDAGNNYWYIDHNITTVNGGACVEVVGLVDAVGTLNGKYYFKVTKAAQQLLL